MEINQKGNILIILAVIVVVAAAGLGYLYLTNASIIMNLIKPEQPIAPITNTSQVTTEAQIAITRAGFIPATITVKKGTQVNWTNKDKVPHRVLSDLSNLDSEEPLNENDSFSFTFETTGTYTYHDEGNLKFKGTVIVE